MCPGGRFSFFTGSHDDDDGCCGGGGRFCHSTAADAAAVMQLEMMNRFEKLFELLVLFRIPYTVVLEDEFETPLFRLPFGKHNYPFVERTRSFISIVFIVG